MDNAKQLYALFKQLHSIRIYSEGNHLYVNSASSIWMMDDIETGSFIIETQKHLQQFNDPALKYFKSTLFAGKAGRLLGKLRGLEVIPDVDRILQFGAETGEYDDHVILDLILPELKNLGCIEIHKDQAGNVTNVEEYINSEKDILKIVSEMWNSRSPTTEEHISLDAIDFCSKLPRLESELRDYIEITGYSKDYNIIVDLNNKFNLLQRYENVPGINENIYHTPLFVRENIVSIANTIKKLEVHERNELDQLISSTVATEAYQLSRCGLNQEKLKAYNKIGLIDVTEVETCYGRSEKFLFTPSIWGPLGSELTKDEQEHVRALLSCIRFGQISPTPTGGKHYPIRDPEAYIEALERKGRIGPATPIGSDYQILEREGIVRIERSSSKPDQYEMVLIKRDIAERARRIISRGRDIALGGPSLDIKPFEQIGTFRNTAYNRMESLGARLKNVGGRSNILANETIKVLRGEKL